MLDILFISFLGGFGAMILDSYWEKKGKKESIKLKAFEHYHNSIILITIGMFAYSTHPTITAGLVSTAIIFLVGEWRQIHYLKDGIPKEGHPFAYGSTHFKQSSVIGMILTAMSIISYFYLSIQNS